MARCSLPLGGLGHCGAQLGNGVYHHRGPEPDLGHLLADLLQTSERPEETQQRRAQLHSGWSGSPSSDQQLQKMSAWQILRNRQFWGIALPRFLAEPAWGTFNAWIPLFMFKAYGFNLKEIAMFAWMPMLFADFGCILGGYLPPFFQKHFKVNLIVSRKLVVTMGAILMIAPGMIGLFTSPYVAIALLCVGALPIRRFPAR
ncbi:MFS transporter [Serratia sp. L9]|uniref:MFS transporter n=1 Tax=Serratia sp. L9 TaxID=3423946 RepID=UPI003D66D4D0